MPFAIRAMLHERTGGYIEETEADAIELQLDLLAHHYWHSENLEKKREYLVRAGEAAEASYANTAAIDYLERAAPLVSEQERVDVLLRLGRVVGARRRLAPRRAGRAGGARERGAAGRRRGHAAGARRSWRRWPGSKGATRKQ